MFDLPGYRIASVLHESAAMHVCRAKRLADDRLVIVKASREGGGQIAEQRLRREFDVLASLPWGLACSPLELTELEDGRLVLSFEDIGAESLKNVLTSRPLSIGEFLHIAHEFGTRLESLHSEGLLHRRLSPDHAVWNSQTGKLRLIGLAAASPSPAIIGLGGSEHQLSALSYTSPEQLGRIEREVGFTSDLYSFGATLYEMLARVPPYGGADELARASSHVTHILAAPAKLRDNVPAPVSNIIMRLLEKLPENRYTSARSVTADLRHCLAAYRSTGRITEADLPSRRLASGRGEQLIYGRHAQLRSFMQWSQDTASAGGRLAALSGVSGVGKTTFAQRVGQQIAQAGGVFAAGKFDQYQRDLPYFPFLRVLERLVSEATQTQTAAAALRQEIQARLGSGVASLLPLLPSLRLIVSEEPGLPVLSAKESTQRTRHLLHQLLELFAAAKPPLVLLIDDCQWAEPESLEFLNYITHTHPVAGLLVIVAFRSDEITDGHPLAITLQSLRESNQPLLEIELEGLSQDAVTAMVKDYFDDSLDNLDQIGSWLHAESEGNPLHLRQLLFELLGSSEPLHSTLQQTSTGLAAAFNASHARTKLGALFLERIRQLPSETQTLLSFAAGLGAGFSTRALAVAADRSEAQTKIQLAAAIDAGLVVASDARNGATPSDGAGGQLEFSHDRVQSSALSGLSLDEQRRQRLSIARRLDAVGLQVQNPGIVLKHYNAAIDLVDSHAERRRIAQMNLSAARAAKQAGASHAALGFLRKACEWTDASEWQDDDGHAIYHERAESELQVGDPDTGMDFARRALSQATDVLQTARTRELLIVQHTLNNDYEAAVQIGREALADLGTALPLHGYAAALETEYAQAAQIDPEAYLDGRADLPICDDARVRAQLRILIALLPPTYFLAPALNNWVEAKMVSISEQAGYSAESAKGLVNLGGLMCLRGSRRKGYALARLALEVTERLDAPQLRPKILHTMANAIAHWVLPLTQVREYGDRAFEECVGIGDLDYAGYVLAFQKSVSELFLAEPLAVFHSRLIEYARYTERTNNGLARRIIEAVTRTVARLQFGDGEAADVPDTASDGDFIAECRRHNHHMAACMYLQLNALIAVSHEDYDTSARLTQAAEELIRYVSSSINLAIQHFLTVATSTGLGDDHPFTADASSRRRVVESLQSFVEMADECPANFHAMRRFLEAEIARKEDRMQDAIRAYQDAIDEGHSVGFPPTAALAARRAAGLMQSIGATEAATAYARRARERYAEWGASGALESLDKQFRGLWSAPAPVAETDPTYARLDLDLEAILKSSLVITSELKPERLFERLLEVLMEAAGADRGILILCDRGELRVEVEATIQECFSAAALSLALDDCRNLPRSVIRRASSTAKPVVVNDTTRMHEYTGYRYFRNASVRSLACLPIVQQQEVRAVIHLENHLVTDAFSSRRMQLLNLLAAQAAIAINNALIVHTLEDEVKQRTANLEEARITAEAANKAKTDFLANVSHEFRTPLNAVMGFSDMLREQRMGDLNAKQMEYVDDIYTSCQHLLDLIRDILDMSKAESGNMNLEIATVDVSETLASSLNFVGPRAAAKNITIENLVDDSVGMISGDARRLKQVFLNLLSNAVKFTPENGRVTVKAHRNASSVEIAVTDTGIGMKSCHLDAIFAPFYRINDSGDEASGGTGLGLALSRQLTELHGGEIHVESAPGQGSTFVVKLPLLQ